MFRKAIITVMFSFVICVSLAAQDKNVETFSPGGNCFDNPPPPCLAQADEPDSFTPGNNRFGKAKKKYFEAQQQQRKHLEQLRMLKLLELLDLHEDQEIEFLTSFRTMRRDHGALQGKKINQVDDLVKELSAEEIDDRRVKQMVNDIMQLEQERSKILKDFIGEVSAFLSAEQLGKLIVFQEKFEVELLENLKNFRSRKGKNP